MRAWRCRAIWGAAALSIGCSEPESKGTTASDAGPPDAYLGQAQVFPLELAHPVTDTSTQPVFTFVAPPWVSQVASALQQQSRFVTVGAEVGALVSLEAASGPNEVRYQIEPSAPLSADTWYWLVIDSSQAVRVNTEELRWSQRFFTSCAPHVTSLMWAKGTLYFSLSEPVDLTTVDGAGLLHEGAEAVTGCITLDGACVSGPDPLWLDGFSLDGSKVKTSATLSLDHAGVWQAGSCTFASASPSAGVTKSLGIAPAEWHSCQQGAAQCWEAPFAGELPGGAK